MERHQVIKLGELELYACDLDSMDQFSELYIVMLDEIQETGDKSMLKAMQKVLMQQVQYLMAQWLKGNRGARPRPLMMMEPGKLN